MLLFNIKRIHKYKDGIETYMQLHHVKKMPPLLFINLLFVTGRQHNCTKKIQSWRKMLQSKGALALLSHLFGILGAGVSWVFHTELFMDILW